MRAGIHSAVASTIVLSGLFLMSSERSAAQGSSEGFSLSSAQRALAVVDDAIVAAGGLDALRRISTVTRIMTSTRTDEGQGAKPASYVRQADRLGAIPSVVNRSSTTSFRDLKGFRAADHLQYDIYGGQYMSRRAVLGATDGFTVYYDYVYRGLRPMASPAVQRAKFGAFRRYPEALLQSLHDRPQSVRWLGESRWEGRAHHVLAFADGDGAQLSLYFDAATHRLSKVESLGEDGVLGDIVIETVYDDYRTVRDVVLPHRIIDRRAGVVLDDNRVSSTVLDLPASDTLFARPTGFDEADFGKPFPNVQKLGDKVYAVLGGYNTIFIEFDQYVLVLEAGGSGQEAETVIARIKQTIPAKPIRYLVTTHWNYDHVSGVRPYIAEGTTIIAPPSAQRVIALAAASPRSLHPDALSRNPRKPVFEALGGKQRTFSDGSRTVTVYDISPSPHSDEMFIAYLPNEKILFEADLLDIVAAGRVGTGGDDTADLAAKIQQLGLDVQRIVPVHGQIGTMDDLRQALARKTER
jgi:glyoxylase-like metal-dependent hydrolase (beta-lactamase superfamily II)